MSGLENNLRVWFSGRTTASQAVDTISIIVTRSKIMKNALILHGTNGNSKHNWFPWLKKELEKKKYKVWVPDLPKANKPNLKKYNKFILRNKLWKFDKHSLLIGHSSGAMAILGLLQELPKGIVVDKCLLIGAFKDSLGVKDLEEIFEKPFDYEYIKNRAGEIIFIHSDDDPFCPLEHAKFLSKKLDAKLIVIKGQKHFSLSTYGEKYRKFPRLLKYIA